MEWLTRFATRRPIGVVVTAATLVLVGWTAARELPVELLPELASPTVAVSLRAGDRPPVEMEQLYGEVMERRLFAVGGIREVSQIARTGRLLATVELDWQVDPDLALIEVQKAVQPLAADPGVDELVVRRFDPTQLPILRLGLRSRDGGLDLAELREIVRFGLVPALEQLPGVAEVRVSGGREREVRIDLDPVRLRAHGVTLEQVEARLRAASQDIEAGSVDHGGDHFLVRGMTRFRSLEDVAQTVVAFPREDERARSPVLLQDLATVGWAEREVLHVVRVGGEEGVGVAVYKEGGANTIAVSSAVRRALDAFAESVAGLELQIVRDQAVLIEEGLADAATAAAIGVLLAVLVLALFLRSVATTAIVASSVPVSLLATALVMRFTGESLNLLTLAGVALASGLLVDNSIVVVESIHRRLMLGDPPREAAARGSAEVAGAIFASTLTTCVVFLPVLFVDSLAAQILSGLASTVVSALSVSLAVALLLVPALSAWLLRAPVSAARPVEMASPMPDATSAASRSLARGVRLALRRSGRVGLVTAALAGVAIAVIHALGTELIAPSDPRQFSLRILGPPGQRVEVTASVVATLEGLLQRALGEDLAALQAEIGRLPEDDLLTSVEHDEENTARILVRLREGGPGGREVAASLGPVIEALPHLEAQWEIGDSPLDEALGLGGPAIEVELAGRSLDDLRAGVAVLRAELADEPALWNVRTSFEGAPPALHVALRRPLADVYGVDRAGVERVLRASLDGLPVSSLWSGGEEYPVRLHLPEPDRGRLADVRLTGGDGAVVALSDVSRIVPAAGAREVLRRDQQRVATVSAEIARGRQLEEALGATRRAIRDTALPPRVSVRLAGEEEERDRTQRQMLGAGALSLLLVWMVLAASFESWLSPLSVLSVLPVAAFGVALALAAWGRPVGVMAMLGGIVLAGVAINNAILMLATADSLRRDGLDDEAALSGAAAVRLRPILMTSLTSILAVLPMALGSGEAADLRRPLALAVIGGMIASTLGSLYVVPCIDHLLRRRRATAAGGP